MTRLETLSQEISIKVNNAHPQKKIDLIYAACEFAINKSNIAHPLIDSILIKIKDDRKLTKNEKLELENLANELDGRYFLLHDDSEKRNSTSVEYIKFFSKARAAFALLFAFNDELELAASEAIYEASMVIDNNNELFTIINKILNEI